MVHLIQSQVNITSTLHMYEGSCASCIVILRHIIVINPMEVLIILSKSFHFTFEVGFELNTHEFAASTMGIYPHSARSTLFKVVASFSCSQKSCVCLKVPEILFRCCICCIYKDNNSRDKKWIQTKL